MLRNVKIVRKGKEKSCSFHQIWYNKGASKGNNPVDNNKRSSDYE